jgi:hypothetical protein
MHGIKIRISLMVILSRNVMTPTAFADEKLTGKLQDLLPVN